MGLNPKNTAFNLGNALACAEASFLAYSATPITQAAGVKPGTRMRLRFADGEVKATADGGRPGDRQGMLPL